MYRAQMKNSACVGCVQLQNFHLEAPFSRYISFLNDCSNKVYNSIPCLLNQVKTNKHFTEIILECFFWENRRTIYGVPMTISFSSFLLPFLANDEDVQVFCMYYRTSWYFHPNILDSLTAWLAGFQLNPVFLFPPARS